MNLSNLFEIMGPALIAGLMISAIHAPLGIEVLKRGIIFIDLSIAQLAGLGMVIATRFAGEDHEPNKLVMQLFALSFALIGAWVFTMIEKKLPRLLEAFIGSTFVVSASLAILLLAGDPHGGEEIEQLLSGQILFASWHNILIHSLVFLFALLVWFGLKSKRTSRIFYFIFALTVTSSVQLVGVYLVFATLVLPALGSIKFSEHNRLVVAYLISAIALIGGLIFSILTDLPTGPVLVCSYALVSLLPVFLKSNTNNSVRKGT